MASLARHPTIAGESLGEALRGACLRFAEHTALVECHRREEPKRWTYREVLRLGEGIAAAFAEQGLAEGDAIAIVMSNQARWVISGLGAFFRGLVVVPVDYKLSPAEQLHLLRHSEAKGLVSEGPVLGPLMREPGWASWAKGVEGMVWCVPGEGDPEGIASWDELARGKQSDGLGKADGAGSQAADGDVLGKRHREDVATIVYSSGTSGSPKGCMLTHGNYLAQYRVLYELFPMGPGHRYFSVLPTNHAIDFMSGFLASFLSGACVVHQRALRPEFITHTLQTEGITHMALVPLLLKAFERSVRERFDAAPPAARWALGRLQALNKRLCGKRARPWLSRRLLGPVHKAFGGKLEVFFAGGAFVEPELAEFFNGLGLPVVIGYGLTEACTVLTVNRLDDLRNDTVGPAVPGTELRVVDAGPDGVGEVQVRGPTVMQGYFRDPGATAEAIADGWLRTGDLGCLRADGHLRLVGRARNRVVTAGGKNVYPEDIEALMASLPCVELAVFSSAYLRSEQDALVADALVAAVRAPATDFPEKLDAVNRSLPDYKRIARWVEVQQAFPRTASLKLKRAQLAERLRRDSGALSQLALSA